MSNKPSNFDEFLKRLEAYGYSISKRGKNIRFHSPEQKNPIRFSSLKDDYTEVAIHERIDGTRVVKTKNKIEKDTNFSQETKMNFTPKEPFKVTLLIDVENSIKAKNSHRYEQWAKIFNLKQAAQTLIYLQENNLDEYEKLEEKSAQTTKEFHQLSGSIKEVESKINDIKELQRHIKNYGKTRDIYADYRKAGYNKKYLVEHEGDIILHQAAKKYFDKIGLKKIPTIKTLQTEYATLVSKKKSLYNAYRITKEEVKNLTTVKSNTDRLLKYSENERHIKTNKNRE